MNNELIKEVEETVKEQFCKINKLESFYSEKVLKAFNEFRVSETDFYGTMDGASKFVKGDATAGLIITLINLVGGIILGVTMF